MSQATPPGRQSSRVAIVTGASSGIGWHTALEMARKGYAIGLAARREERLTQLADECARLGGQTLVVPTDITQSGAVGELVDRVVATFGRLDVMVNNAGRGHFAPVVQIPMQDLRDVMEVNFFSLFEGCRAAGEVMIRQRSGHIFNVSSVLGRRGTPMHGAYCASKFAVVGLTESLRVEMAPYGVRVTCVCPGLTDTEFFSGYAGGGTTSEKFRWLRTMMKPRTVARRMVRSVGKSRPELVFTPGGRFLARVGPLLPGFTDRIMSVYRKRLLEDQGNTMYY